MGGFYSAESFRVGGFVMRHIVIAALSLLSLASIPADAADLRPAVARPAAQPAAAQPAQSNWSGVQVGGQNGVSGVNNNFAEPGAYICPTGFPFGSSCFETPFGFSNNHLSYTIGGFVGYRIQAGSYVYGIEGDLS